MLKRFVSLLTVLAICGCGKDATHVLVVEPSIKLTKIELDNRRAEAPSEWTEPPSSMDRDVHARFVDLPRAPGDRGDTTVVIRKGVEGTTDYLVGSMPEDWQSVPVDRGLGRVAQFKLPRYEKDPEDAELIVFSGLGGTASANVERWKGQFDPPDGKKIDDVAVVTPLRVDWGEVTRLDVLDGTYKDKPFPRANPDQVELRKDYRMIALHVESDNHTIHVKLIGPKRTIAKHEESFNKWLKSLGKPDATVAQWSKQFNQKKNVQRSTIAEGGLKGATRFDVTGTYLDKSVPAHGHEDATERPGYRLVGVYFQGPRNVYHVELVGPKASVEKNLPAFDKWLKSFQ